MEPWEIELEFLTYDEFERVTNGQRSEEYETDEEYFKQEVGKMEESRWEEVDPDNA